MTSLFDGMSGILAGVFGGSVRYEPVEGFVRDVASIFRETPVEVVGADGQAVLIEAPTWRVARTLVPEVRRGDVLRVGDGRLFTITAIHTAGSPAADAFLLCELHLRPA